MSITPENFYYSDEINNQPNIFYNTLVGVSIAVENHFKDLLFKGDINRIIYASDGYAFKERSRKNDILLGIPFMNYYLQGMFKDTGNRQLWNNEAQVIGLRDIGQYQKELGRPIRAVPVRMSFESSVFFSQPFDAMYAYQKLADDSANEIILESTYLTENNLQISNSVFITYEPVWSPEYTEQEWLQDNKIIPIGMNFEAITLFLFTDTGLISLSEEVIMNFIASKNVIQDIENIDELSPNQIIMTYLT